MKDLSIAFRNIFRNVRRSFMTMSAIAVGAIALLLFGEFFMEIMLGLQTSFVTKTGHINVFKKGAFEFGTGNPGAYGISNYEEVMKSIAQDEQLRPLIHVLTPTVKLFGIAGNYEQQVSKTFFGVGMIPDDFNRMRKWDEHQLKWDEKLSEPVMTSQSESHGIVGVGLAKILGLCSALQLGDCQDRPEEISKKVGSEAPRVRDFGDLGQSDIEESKMQVKVSSAINEKTPRLDLLAGTASGAPNVVSFYVDRAVTQGVKEYDDSFVGLHFHLAQQLLYGRNDKQANGIIIQLHHTSDMDFVRTRLEKLFRDHHWDLEVRDLLELQPFYKQAVGMFSFMFMFIAIIMAVIALFTVINTMSMSVMERTQEIGTLRALGVRRKGVTKQFVLEGSILGVMGASLGLILGNGIAFLINHSGVHWLPPGQSEQIPLQVLTHGVAPMLLVIWLGLIAIATLASWIPARRAARMKIVDALGHV